MSNKGWNYVDIVSGSPECEGWFLRKKLTKR
jgi:hypothetical protein